MIRVVCYGSPAVAVRGLASILVCFVCCGAPAVAVRIMDSVMQIRPKSADVKKWTDVWIHADQIVIKGGCNSKGELADSIQYKDADGVTHQFVAYTRMPCGS